MATVRDVFETNTFGVMAMTAGDAPQLRARRFGMVVNVMSSVTLAHELAAFNIQVKLVEPGLIDRSLQELPRRVYRYGDSNPGLMAENHPS